MKKYTFQGKVDLKPKTINVRNIILIFLLLFLILPAKAQLSFCNKSTDTSFSDIAIGHFVNGNWVSEGWFKVPQGECRIILPRILNRYYYYYDASTDLDLVAASPKGDEMVFCVTDQPFTILLHQNCLNNDHKQKPFVRLDTGNFTSFQVDLISPHQVNQGIEDIVRTTRKSLINDSRVIIMRNKKPFYVSFTLECSRPNGATKRFNINIPPYSSTELGFMQGWPENFLPGDQCTAFWEDAIVWTFKPY